MSEDTGNILDIELSVAFAGYVAASDLIGIEISQLTDIALSK
jgi:hypothetical protein